MGRRLSPLLAGIGLLGALAWFARGASGPRPASAPDTAPIAADLDARIRETLAGVQARADTLAQLPRLGVAVATDERTVRDLTGDELAFRTRPGEHIEIAQVARKNGQDGPVHSLLRLPDDKLPLAMASLGPHLMIAGGSLQVVVYVAVTPRDRADELRGALAVAQAPDLAPFAQRLEALGLSGRLEVGGQSAALDGGVAPDGKAAGGAPLTTGAPETITLAFVGGAAAGPGSSRAHPRPIGGPVVLLLVSLAGAALLWRRGAAATPLAAAPTPLPSPARHAPRTTPAPSLRPAPTPTPTPVAGSPAPLPRPAPALTPVVGSPLPPPRSAPTPTPIASSPLAAKPLPARTPGAGFAVAAPLAPIIPAPSAPLPIEMAPADSGGTPGPELFDEESTGVTSAPNGAAVAPALQAPSLPARPRLPKEAPRPTATLPSYLFEVVGNPDRPTSPSTGTPVNEDALGREYRALYVEFIKMRRTCREPIDNLDADRFVAALRQQRDQLSQKHANKEICFRLAFDNGKAAIRFVIA